MRFKKYLAIFTLDKSLLTEHISSVSSAKIANIEAGMRLVLGLQELLASTSTEYKIWVLLKKTVSIRSIDYRRWKTEL